MQWTHTSLKDAREHFEKYKNKMVISGFIFDPELVELFVKYLVTDIDEGKIKYQYYYTNIANIKEIDVEKYNSVLNVLDKDVCRVTKIKKVLSL